MMVHRQKCGNSNCQPAKGAAAKAPRRIRYAAFLATVLPAAGMLLSGAPVRADGKLGTWLTDDQKAKIELRECGDSGLCSKIVWLKEPVDENGQAWQDELNPDPAKRGRAIIGLDILKGLKKVGGQTWTGEIYDPQEGKFYYLKRIVVRPDKVEIRGCLSTGWPCRSKYWTRTAPVRQQEPIQVARQQTAPVNAARPAPTPQVARKEPAPQPARRAEAASTPKPRPQIEASAAAAPPILRPESQAKTGPVERPPMPQARPATAQARVASAVPAQAPPPQPQTRQQRRPLPWQRERRYANAAPAATGSLPRPVAAAPRGSAYLVQVTAGQDQNEALRTFGKLQSRYPHLLGGYLPNIQRVDLGEKGVWYRVRVGPMGPQTAASSFCQQLKAAGADCLIRRE